MNFLALVTHILVFWLKICNASFETNSGLDYTTESLQQHYTEMKEMVQTWLLALYEKPHISHLGPSALVLKP